MPYLLPFKMGDDRCVAQTVRLQGSFEVFGHRFDVLTVSETLSQRSGANYRHHHCVIVSHDTHEFVYSTLGIWTAAQAKSKAATILATAGDGKGTGPGVSVTSSRWWRARQEAGGMIAGAERDEFANPDDYEGPSRGFDDGDYDECATASDWADAVAVDFHERYVDVNPRKPDNDGMADPYARLGA